MKYVRTIRRVDKLGRIVLPIELRKAMDIGDRDTLEIIAEGDTVFLKKAVSTCVFCDGTKDLGIFRNKHLCMNCLRELQQVPLDL